MLFVVYLIYGRHIYTQVSEIFRVVLMIIRIKMLILQYANAKYRNIVGRNMLCAFGHRVAICCDTLGFISSSLKMVKFEPTTSNMLQHVVTRWPNARNMLRPTMLRYVALACCDRLAGALWTSLTCWTTVTFQVNHHMIWIWWKQTECKHVSQICRLCLWLKQC